jgi:hypothetical protein
LPPSLNFTVPVGVLPLLVTVAVSVTELLGEVVNDELFVELELRDVVVFALVDCMTVITRDQLVTDTGSPFKSPIVSLSVSVSVHVPLGVAPVSNWLANVALPSLCAHSVEFPPTGSGG